MARGPRKPRWSSNWLSTWSRASIALACAGAVLVLALLGITFSSPQNRSVPTTHLRIATGNMSGVYYPLGQALARIYSDQLPDVRASAEATAGIGYNVEAIENGQADLAFTQDDIAYFAAKHGSSADPRPFQNVRAIAALFVNAVQIIVRRDGPVHRLVDLYGRHIGITASTSGAKVLQLLLASEGLDGHVAVDSMSLADVADRIRRGEIDGAFVLSSYPVPVIAQLNAAVAIRLLPIDKHLAGRIRAEHPFFRPIVIPDGTYDGQGGDVPTIGVDNLLICRAGLPDALVYRLTGVFIDSLPALASVNTAAASIDLQQAPATQVPLHPGAAWFYREREMFR